MNFLVIGAQKSGTTWLYKRLQELDEFSLYPIKELHYFDRSDQYLSHSILKQTKLSDRILNRQWLITVAKDLTNSLINESFADFRWKKKYYLSTYDDKWYCSLFKTRTGITGDITPAYAILDEATIQNIQNILPNVKIIFLLRNPVERAWSHFKFSKRHVNSTKIDHQQAIDFFNSPQQELRSDYIKTIQLYQNIFPPQQILIGFFDAIKDQPLNLLTRIVDFLGSESNNISAQCNLQEKNNYSTTLKIPVELRAFLLQKYKNPIKRMAKEFGGYCTTWIENNNHSFLPPPVYLSDQLLTFEQ